MAESSITMRTPFPDHQVSKLPKGTKAQNGCPADEKKNCAICGGWHHPKIKHLDYVGHAALTDRLLDVDPSWYWEPLALKDGLPAFDAIGGLWIKLTVNGVTRIGYGNAELKEHMDKGAREKEVIGDALRNAAMRFGAALDLWHKGILHIEEDDGNAASAKPALITPDPVDAARVSTAVVWLKEMIDADSIDDTWKKVQINYERLSNNERMAVDAQLKEKAPGSDRSYRNILKDYLNYKPTPAIGSNPIDTINQLAADMKK